jgi:hypothetical protein
MRILTGFLIAISLSASAEPMNNYADAVHEMNRKYNFTATAQPIGFGPTATLGYGINLGYYLSGSSILLLEFTNSYPSSILGSLARSYATTDANGNSSSSSSVRWDTDTSAQSLGLHYKKFLYGGFYIKGGLVYRSIKVIDSFRNAGNSAADQTNDYQGASYAGVVALGNQWNIYNFTIGCDWIGYVHPFSSVVTSESYSGATTEYGRTRISDSKKAYLTDGSAQLVRLYVGASF